MNLEFLYLMNVVLASRLAVVLRDEPARGLSRGVAMLGPVGGLLVFTWNGALWQAGAALAVLGVLAARQESRPGGPTTGRRLAALGAYALVCSVLCAPAVGLRFADGLQDRAATLGQWFLPAELLLRANWPALHAWGFGLLLAAGEANLLVRLIIEAFEVRPRTVAATAGSDRLLVNAVEYRRGRLIGVLERLLIFALIMHAQFGALGFVAVAKGIARFKNLERQDFAEYFLIGTLISVVLAGLAALLARALLP